MPAGAGVFTDRERRRFIKNSYHHKIIIMKKTFLIFCIAFMAIASHAQFAHTTWKGAIKGDAAQAAVLKFSKDTLVLAKPNGEVIETMKFSVKNGVMTLKKISGQSDCDNVAIGKYTATVTGKSLALTVTADACQDRIDGINKTQWVKQ